MESVTVDRTDRRRRDFRSSPTSLRSMRAFVTTCLREAGVPSPRIEDARLVVSELGANAVQHGAGPTVVVTVGLDDDLWWTIQVSNRIREGHEIPHDLPATWAPVPPHASSGRGLAIVRDVCSDVAVSTDDGTLTVTCRLGRRAP